MTPRDLVMDNWVAAGTVSWQNFKSWKACLGKSIWEQVIQEYVYSTLNMLAKVGVGINDEISNKLGSLSVIAF